MYSSVGYGPSAGQAELQFPAGLARGAAGPGVRRLQEWLSFSGFVVEPDGEFGPATEATLKAFTQLHGGLGIGVLDESTWAMLVARLVSVLGTRIASQAVPAAVLEVARAHLEARPVEIGGDNRGPWVRLYMNGVDGAEKPWCAGFLTFVITQACSVLGVRTPIQGSESCDQLAGQAKQAGLFVKGDDLASGKVSWSALGPCAVFLARKGEADWTHTGFAFGGSGETFRTIEGNAAHKAGSKRGYEVNSQTRSISGKDFIRLG